MQVGMLELAGFHTRRATAARVVAAGAAAQEIGGIGKRYGELAAAFGAAQQHGMWHTPPAGLVHKPPACFALSNYLAEFHIV